jgi:Cof subfamily protein (haloacid dehalogenase superfamily)
MSRIRLLVSDVDGTLVTRDKRLTPATVAAVEDLRKAGIGFTVTSARPGFGMRMIVEPLRVDLPFGPFNGSSIMAPDHGVLEQHLVPRAAIDAAIALLEKRGIDIWLFTNNAWIIRRDDGRYVAHEQNTIRTPPQRVTDDGEFRDGVCKLVGVSADFATLADVEKEMQAALGSSAHVARSQDYYLDVTPPDVSKGTFVAAMAKRLGIDVAEIATIGDMPNDVAMFRAAGLSFAMGQSSAAVQKEASRVTASNADDGFALAVAEILRG